MISFTSTVVRRCSPKGFSLAPGRFFASSRSVLNQEGKEFDVVVYGASGYTGRLVAEYIQQTYGHTDLKWALAGRSLDKLSAVGKEMGIDSDVPHLQVDAGDPSSLQTMVNKAKVVLTTVGPYQLYGSAVVQACAVAGTDYVDLCGEPAWMHDMIAEHSQAAQASGARIVFSCGFDSIPFDLGVYFLQQVAQQRLGGTCRTVKGRVRSMKGTFSGGTIASLRATLMAVKEDKKVREVLMNPFSLTPGFKGPQQPLGVEPFFDEATQSWATPFIMAAINTKNVHRSNLLLNHAYGTDFVYDEMLLTGRGEKGEKLAKHLANSSAMKDDPQQPGDGPSKQEREEGSYDVLFIGETDDKRSVQVSVRGDRDPGYGSTSKMIVESALCLLENPDMGGGGIWTPAPVMGTQLIDRLQSKAGLTFTDETK